MANPTERLVLDADVLITVDREKHRPLQRLLRRATEDGRLVLPSFVISKLGKYKGKRKWAARFVHRYGNDIETRFHVGEEHTLFSQKMLLHPGLATDDVQSLVIAKVRQWTLVTHEKLMTEAAQQQHVQCINSLEELQRVLEGRLLL